jgi:predicted transcriptional regulator/transcriptional regulator with XRE-family HTH domain
MIRPAAHGARIRRLRREQGYTQVALAERLGISPSYLNLIEHNRRALTPPLLLKLGEQLRVDIASISDPAEGRLLAELREVAGDPLFADVGLGESNLIDLVEVSPGACRALVKLYRAYRSAREDIQLLGERLSGDPFVASSAHQLRTLLTSVRSFSEILHDNVDLAVSERRRFRGIVVEQSENMTRVVNDLLAFVAGEDLTGRLGAQAAPVQVADFLEAHHNFFEEIEDAAETLRREAGPEGPGRHDRLIHYLAEHYGTGDLPATRSRASLAFNAAARVGGIIRAEAIEHYLGDPHLDDDDGRALCRQTLANYFAAAVLMPYGDFLEAARACRYDLELLGENFGVSFEQVCHRLTTLNRPGARGVPFHFVRLDIAGNISKRFSASGFRIPRYGGACPRWNVHAAFLTPDRIDVQIARLPDGATYLCLARAVIKSTVGHAAPRSLHAIGLGTDVGHARELVYGDGLDLEHAPAVVPIGTSCRICERLDCAQRAFPALLDPNATASAGI